MYIIKTHAGDYVEKAEGIASSYNENIYWAQVFETAEKAQTEADKLPAFARVVPRHDGG